MIKEKKENIELVTLCFTVKEWGRWSNQNLLIEDLLIVLSLTV